MMEDLIHGIHDELVVVFGGMGGRSKPFQAYMKQQEIQLGYAQ